jgi:hypothetical protein
MPLSGENLGDLPDWVSEGYEAVAQTFTEVDPEVQQVSNILLAFSNEKGPASKLFKVPDAKVSNAELRGFKITRVGDPDEPDVELHFKAFCPYSRPFWAWLGEMAGKEVFMGFPASLVKASGPVEKSGNLPLTPATPAPAAKPGTAKAAPKGKSGPKDLESFHQGK